MQKGRKKQQNLPFLKFVLFYNDIIHKFVLLIYTNAKKKKKVTLQMNKK